MEKISREKFIRLSSALGVGAAAASLVACGGGSGGSSGGSSGGDSGGSGEQEKARSPQASEQAKGGGGSEESKQPKSSSADEEAKGGGGSGGNKKAEAPQAGGAAIAQEAQVKPGSAFKFKEGGQPAVLVHLESGDFVAYSAICTHQGCTVAYDNAQLVCPCHGSIFDPANGAAVVTGPAASPLPEIPVTVEGGQVLRA